ncbi:MAG TPA: UbiA family prenyltransferase [Thermodesulfobacteriota bacterium]|nr:UbiA family prenyltransferase [Thermodesulfobacteriota bacterium]
MIKTRDIYIFIFRITRYVGWSIAPLVFLTGLYYSKAGLASISSLELVLLSFPYAILLFGINDIYDHQSDLLNPRKSNIPIGGEEKRLIVVISGVTAVLMILASALTLNIENIIITSVLLLTSYKYSSGQYRLKEIPVIDSISNGLIFLLVFALGYSFGDTVFNIPLKIYFVALCVAAIHAFGTVVDYEVDKKVGHNTFCVFVGKRFTLLFIFSAFLSAYYFAEIGRNFINYYFVFCVFLTVIVFIKPVHRIAYNCFKLLFAGFIVTSLIFLFTY